MVYWEGRITLLVFGSPLMADATQNPSTGAPQPSYVDLTADIVAAYVVKNAVQRADLPSLIATVHSALSQAARGATEQPQEGLRPAVPIKKSVTPDFLICLEDGQKSKVSRGTCERLTISLPRSIGRSGVYRKIIRWSPRDTPRRVPVWRRPWVLGKSVPQTANVQRRLRDGEGRVTSAPQLASHSQRGSLRS